MQKTETIIVRGEAIQIDTELVDLIRSLNDVGLKTKQCCSGHGAHCAYVTIDLSSIVDVVVSPFRNEMIIWWNSGKVEDTSPDYQECRHVENAYGKNAMEKS